MVPLARFTLPSKKGERKILAHGICNLHILTYFLQHRITALAMACKNGYDEIATLLIEHGADVNSLEPLIKVGGISVHKH